MVEESAQRLKGVEELTSLQSTGILLRFSVDSYASNTCTSRGDARAREKSARLQKQIESIQKSLSALTKRAVEEGSAGAGAAATKRRKTGAPLTPSEMSGQEILQALQAAGSKGASLGELVKAIKERRLRIILPELNSQNGRINAKKVAEFLDVPLAKLCAGLDLNYTTIHKHPDSDNAQPALRPVKRSLEILHDVFGEADTIRAWMNTLHPDLGMTPLEAILDGKVEALHGILENAVAGIPS